MGPGPVRTCLGCGRRLPQAELVRLVAREGLVVADFGRVLPGRGGYCCPNAGCYRRLIRQGRRLAWALLRRAGEGGGLVPAPGLAEVFDGRQV
ncbi:MAG: YlxR family protein [Desulfobacteraceae bacterium]|nr:YlxR family protein [Desulfobacteraceae bacterium]